MVEHIARTHSDHTPILVRLQGVYALEQSVKPFRILLAWQEHQHFQDFLGKV